MKHEKEIDDILDSLFREEWMTKEEQKKLIEETFTEMGITKQQLSDELEAGVKNGHPVEKQLKILKQLIQ